MIIPRKEGCSLKETQLALLTKGTLFRVYECPEYRSRYWKPTPKNYDEYQCKLWPFEVTGSTGFELQAVDAEGNERKFRWSRYNFSLLGKT